MGTVPNAGAAETRRAIDAAAAAFASSARRPQRSERECCAIFRRHFSKTPSKHQAKCLTSPRPQLTSPVGVHGRQPPHRISAKLLVTRFRAQSQ
ncbi:MULTISPECIES: hypothetical protein [unclassified Mesorhizobium]|uniref:hypothetical protein n=1 Tax=unclassified Mesorhizobium TaxID=325217 RepID=UPI001FDF93B8|nr:MULTISPECIES: hypothetical protein [unclassified Mesorhizobium]